jgi:hypothetical protein
LLRKMCRVPDNSSLSKVSCTWVVAPRTFHWTVDSEPREILWQILWNSEWIRFETLISFFG